MNATDDRAKSIFLNAADLASDEERSAYVEAECAGNESLRAEVLDLLSHRKGLGSFLEQPAMGGDVTILHESPIAEGPGTVIGPYKLLQQIGEGGMGVVFMAEQTEPIQRTVALKIIKPGMDTRQVIARFEAERQAVAMMDHPNIAKVLDAGTTDSGRPYFVMELVKGVPITKYCDEKHLPLRARLELFVEVCQAVQHAHQKGIIHRDIKPNNVLVAEYDHQTVPKVIDFGVAKATAQKLTERTMFTEFGQVLGTMEYMSPEQSKFNQLDIDTRSDIYSLGVLLYELLAGSTPFEGKRLHEAAFDEMLRIIREEEPPKPSTRLSTTDALPSIAANRGLDPSKLSGMIRGELDWIVMKALEKDRNRRYETANALALDLQHYLTDEPIDARPATRIYRLKKFIRRNKVGVLTSLIITVSLIIGLALASIGLVQARRQAQIARSQAAEATRMTQRATQVEQFLQEMLGSINPDTETGATVTVQQVLDRAAEKIDLSFENQPAIRAILHETIGKTYYGLELYEPATKNLQLAVDLHRRYLPEEQLELATALLKLAESETAGSGNQQNALACCREALAIFSAQLPENDSRVVTARGLESQLAGQVAGQPTLNVWSAAALPFLSILTDKQLAQMPPEWARAVAEAKRLHRAGNTAGAIAVIRQYRIDGMEKLRKLCTTGQQEAAQRFIRAHYSPFLDVLWMRPLMSLAFVNATNNLKSLGADPLVIEAMLREAVVLGHTVWGPEHPHIAWALYDLAMLLRDQGRLGEAETAARESLQMRRKLLGNENPDTKKSLNSLIDILQQQDKKTEVEKLRREFAEPIEQQSAALRRQPSADKNLPNEDQLPNNKNSTSLPQRTTKP